jgi:rubrerythrin
MIREIIPDCGGQSSERAVTLYRMWQCWDCGLQFSMKTREPPTVCPRCCHSYEGLPPDIEGTLL